MDWKKYVYLFLAAVFIALVVHYAYQNNFFSGKTSGLTSVPARSQEASGDIRNCISGEVEGQMNAGYLTGRKFQNFCMSGEWGTFEAGGNLPVEWGLDYAGENGTRPRSGTGSWKFENGKLVITGSSISDGDYSDFRFYEYKNDVFAVPMGAYCGMFIGSNFDKIEKFFDDKYDAENCIK